MKKFIDFLIKSATLSVHLKYHLNVHMTTKLISLAEYRSNLSTLWKEAKTNNIRYVVMVRSEPVFEVNPIHGNTFTDDFIPKLVELPKEQITPELQQKIDTSMKKPISSFHNI